MSCSLIAWFSTKVQARNRQYGLLSACLSHNPFSVPLGKHEKHCFQQLLQTARWGRLQIEEGRKEDLQTSAD